MGHWQSLDPWLGEIYLSHVARGAKAASRSRVRKAVEEHYARLTAQQKRTADYLLGHHRTAFSLSVSELALEAGVSDATVVRFARQIGYAGYQELRHALTDEVKREQSSRAGRSAGLSPQARFAKAPAPREPEGTLARVAQSEMSNIAHTVADIDPKALRRFVGYLRKARTVATLGLGASSMLARFAQYLLFQIGCQAIYLSRDTVTLAEQTELLPKRSLLWAFSFPPYSKQTIEAAARASERDIPIVAVTDSVRSPVCALAAATLYARSENLLFTNALSSAVVLINAAVTDLALADKPRALERLRATAQASQNEYL